MKQAHTATLLFDIDRSHCAGGLGGSRSGYGYGYLTLGLGGCGRGGAGGFGLGSCGCGGPDSAGGLGPRSILLKEQMLGGII